MIGTIEKKDIDINSMKIWITSVYDFLMIAEPTSNGEFVPFQFSVPFEGIFTTQIKFRETVIKPLNCKKYDTEYVSKQ